VKGASTAVQSQLVAPPSLARPDLDAEMECPCHGIEGNRDATSTPKFVGPRHASSLPETEIGRPLGMSGLSGPRQARLPGPALPLPRLIARSSVGSFWRVSRWRTRREEPLWHICGTQSPKSTRHSVNEPAGTTHEFGDRGQPERALIALLIRRSSVRARRGPPHVSAGQRPFSCLQHA
jgi:hypothetical protein